MGRGSRTTTHAQSLGLRELLDGDQDQLQGPPAWLRDRRSGPQLIKLSAHDFQELEFEQDWLYDSLYEDAKLVVSAIDDLRAGFGDLARVRKTTLDMLDEVHSYERLRLSRLLGLVPDSCQELLADAVDLQQAQQTSLDRFAERQRDYQYPQPETIRKELVKMLRREYHAKLSERLARDHGLLLVHLIGDEPASWTDSPRLKETAVWVELLRQEPEAPDRGWLVEKTRHLFERLLT